MKTADLTGMALAYAVALAMPDFTFHKREHVQWPDDQYWVMDITGRIDHYVDDTGNGFNRHYYREPWRPDEDWSQGGPIIEREKIDIEYYVSMPAGAPVMWLAVQRYNPDHQRASSGPTPLIAAMRCYVASKLGDEIDIPKELQ